MVMMSNSGLKLTLARFLALNLVSIWTVNALGLAEKIQRSDGSFFRVKSFANLVEPYNAISLKRQTDTIGSWALRTTTCPQGTIECNADYTEGKPCCPSNTKCYDPFSTIICCPTGRFGLPADPMTLQQYPFMSS